jgi:hypothetical protein
LLGGEVGAFGAVDDVEETEFDGVGHGDTEVEVPKCGMRSAECGIRRWSSGVME